MKDDLRKLTPVCLKVCGHDFLENTCIMLLLFAFCRQWLFWLCWHLFTLTLTFCFQRYIETDPAGRLDETISVWFLTQNNEPDSFTKFFPYWTINGISVYGQLYFILLFINKDTILIFWSLPFHGSCIHFMSYFMIVVIFSIFFLNLNNFVSNLKWPFPFLYTLLSIFQICGEVSVL